MAIKHFFNSSKTDIILQIEQLLNITLFPANPWPSNLLGGLMAYKRNAPKYVIHNDRLIGLNLANTGLTNTIWKELVTLKDFQPKDIQALNLSDNELTEFQLPLEMKPLEHLYLHGNPLTFPPQEIYDQGNDAILRFLKDIQTQGEQEVYEVKMLIVGEGGTGKTTLWHKLQDPYYPVPLPPEKQPSTVGIEIKEGWEFKHTGLDNTPFLVNLWDFGGQEIQYMTHQFFLTRRSFYVLLADGRREIANFPYWFKAIHLLGYDPNQEKPMPVLVVLNEKGNTISKMPYDQEAVKKDFPDLSIIKREVDFAKKDDRLEGLVKAIQEILCHQMEHLPLRIPTYWNDVREALYKLRDEEELAHITMDAFEEVCRNNQLTKEASMLDLSQLLHDLGVILHYQHDDRLADFIILNPQWAVNAIYEILNHEQVAEEQGRFTQKFLTQVWKQKGYTNQERVKLMDLMLKDSFEVCFQAEEKGETIYIAPQLLPDVRPETNWKEGVEALRYTYQYPFMPKGLIGRLIVRLHTYLETNEERRKILWGLGMVLHRDNCRVLIMETEDKATGGKIITIEIQEGDAEDRRFLLKIIREQVDHIHNRSFPNLKFEEKIPCCCDTCLDPSELLPEFYNLSHLQKAKTKGKTTIECRKSFEDVSISSLLEGVYGDEMRMGKSNPIKDQVKGLVSKGNLKEAIEALQKHVGPDFENDITHLRSQFAEISRKESLGMADNTTAQVRNRIRDAILKICDQSL